MSDRPQLSHDFDWQGGHALWRRLVEILMAYRRSRLLIRIPWMVEAVAEGPIAVSALAVIVVFTLVAKGLGWW